MDNDIEIIKDKLDIITVIESYVKLVKSGKNFKACCPFHNEKTPSFFVSPERQMFYCFGCQKGGDIFNFVQEIENIDFLQALKILASKAGVDIKRVGGERIKKTERDKIFKCNEIAMDFFSKQINKSDVAKKYIEKRNISQETLKVFSIGATAKKKDELMNLFLEKGYTKEEIVRAGFAVIIDNQEYKIREKYINRLMIPIKNTFGQVIGFTGRSLDEAQQPKYLNSPETEIFKKQKILYGYFEAKEQVKKENEFVLMEGNLDVVLAHQNGIKNAIASSGTAFSEYQARIIKRIAEKIKIVFDADNAGQNATISVINEVTKNDIEASVVKISNGKDPDEAIKINKEKFLEDLRNPKKAFDFMFEFWSKKFDPETPKGKVKILKEMSEFIYSLQNEIEKDFYTKKLAKYLQISQEAISKDVNKQLEFYTKKIRKYDRMDLKYQKTKNVKSDIEYVLSFVLSFPKLFSAQDFPNLEKFCETELQKKLLNSTKIVYNVDYDEKNSKLLAKINILTTFGEKEYSHLPDNEKINLAKKIYERLEKGRGDDYYEAIEKFEKAFF